MPEVTADILKDFSCKHSTVKIVNEGAKGILNGLTESLNILLADLRFRSRQDLKQAR